MLKLDNMDITDDMGLKNELDGRLSLLKPGELDFTCIFICFFIFTFDCMWIKYLFLFNLEMFQLQSSCLRIFY